MPTPRTRLRLVLLQVRDERVSLLHEQSCFIERCKVARRQITFINLPEEPDLRWRHVESAHAVLIGGAGGYTATKRHAFTKPLVEIVQRLIDDDRPIFGSCWGHQFLAGEFGGRVIEDHDRSEVGTFFIELTDRGRADPLFEGFPGRFYGQLGHNDRVDVLGDQWDELARSDLCPYQAIRLRGKPAYGTQFHGELDERRLQERLEMYREAYAADPAEFERIIRTARPSLWADGLMARFLELYA
jgi:GMP synthase (glutamine-hydrolysing)